MRECQSTGCKCSKIEIQYLSQNRWLTSLNSPCDNNSKGRYIFEHIGFCLTQVYVAVLTAPWKLRLLLANSFAICSFGNCDCAIKFNYQNKTALEKAHILILQSYKQIQNFGLQTELINNNLTYF